MLDNIFGIVNNFNDLNRLKIYNLISQKGGGDYSGIIKLLLGIILLVVAAVFVYLINYYKTTSALVSDVHVDNLYKHVTLAYNIDNIPHVKQLTLGNTHNVQLGSNMTIYYDQHDPSIISLDINSYYILAVLFGIAGLYIIFINNTIIPSITNHDSIYSTDENLSDIRFK